MSEREMVRLLALLEASLGQEWVQIGDWLRSQNSLDAIEERLLAGDLAGVIAEVETAAAKFAAETTEAYVTAGQKAAKWLDDKVDDALIRFDVTNQRAVRRAVDNQYELIRGFTAEQREVTRTIVSDGLRVGRNPREMARDLRGSIGLTEHQAAHVQSYRRALEDGDFANALGRELRDGRSDRLLRRLARDGEQLSAAQIDKMVETYRRNYIAHRAEVIARTEALRAAHEGTEELFRQALERGEVEADELVRTWNAGGGARTRDSHRAMDGQQRAFGEAFTSGDGYALRYPGDPAAPASETINCRCAVSTEYAAAAAA